MKIGITGATGLLGKLVIEHLKKSIAAKDIVALARDPQKAASLGVEVRLFDYNQPEGLQPALQGIDKLLLISGSEIGKRLEQHFSVVNAAKAAGVKHFIYTSVLRADTSTLALAYDHLETEKAIKSAGLTYTILRNGWYTENYTGSLKEEVKHGAILGSVGDGKVSSAARVDYAEAAATVLATEGHENKTYELAGDESYTFSDFAAVVSQQSGTQVVYKDLPVNEYAKVLASFGLPEDLAQFFAEIHIPTKEGALFDDGHQLSKLIGRKTTPLAKVIADALA